MPKNKKGAWTLADDIEEFVKDANERLKEVLEASNERYRSVELLQDLKDLTRRSEKKILTTWGVWGDVPQAGPYEERLLDVSNEVAFQKIVEGLGNQAFVLSTNTDHHHNWVFFHLFDADGEPSPAANTIHETFQQLEAYPVLDEDDYSRRESEATEANIIDVAERIGLREDLRGEENQRKWVGAVWQWFADNEDNSIQNDLESKDDQGGYPSDDNMRQALHELGFLDPDEEADYYKGEAEFQTRYIGDVQVDIAYKMRASGGWTGYYDANITIAKRAVYTVENIKADHLTYVALDDGRELANQNTTKLAAGLIGVLAVAHQWKDPALQILADQLQEHVTITHENHEHIVHDVSNEAGDYIAELHLKYYDLPKLTKKTIVRRVNPRRRARR